MKGANRGSEGVLQRNRIKVTLWQQCRQIAVTRLSILPASAKDTDGLWGGTLQDSLVQRLDLTCRRLSRKYAFNTF